MKFGFVLDEPPPNIALGTYLSVKCTWCGRRRFAVTTGNGGPVNTNICNECAKKLLHAKNMYQA